MDWLNGFFVPILKTAVIGGVIIAIAYYPVKAFHKAWTRHTKWVIKYKVFRRKYPEKALKWCVACIEKGIGYYDAKKLLLIKMVDQSMINEILYIYDQVLNELKGGYHGRELKRSNSSFESPGTGEESPFPSI